MKVKQKMFVHKYADSLETDKYIFFFNVMTDPYYVCFGEVELEFDVPEIDIRAAQLEAIDKQITQTRAEFERKLTALAEQKNNLLAIGVDV